MTSTHDNLVPFERTPEYWIKRAKKRKNNSEHSLAGFLYRQAFEQSRQSDIAMQMAENYFQMGCYSAVRRIALDQLQITSRDPQALFWLGMTALEQKDEDLGERALSLALKSGPDLPIADHIQDLLSDYAWTEPKTFRRSERAWCLYQRALDKLYSGNLDATENLLRRAITRGICPEAEALLGELLLNRKEYSESVSHIKAALEHIEDNSSIWLLLAQGCYAENRPDEANDAFFKALSLTTTAWEWSIAAAAAFFINCADVVRDAVKTALKNAPESNDLLYVLAAIEANSGHVTEAIRCLNILLNRDPDDRDAKMALCVLGFGPVPFCRIPDDTMIVNQIITEAPLTGDRALIRLIHGLTISLGGAASYHDVSVLTSILWNHMNPLQRFLCDRRSDWPNAFYNTLCRCFRIEDLPETAALWPNRHHRRRIQRMSRYLSGILVRKGVIKNG